MLIKPGEMFDKAMKGGYAVGAFNSSNLELTQAIVRAAKRMKSPVIVETSESAIEYVGMNVFRKMVEAVTEEEEWPVVLHLDHGKSFEMAEKCIKAGYGSVMIDVSKKSIGENIVETRRVVDYAHARGVWVEAELGAILGAEGAKSLAGKRTPKSYLTDPREAKRFVEETGVDALAVSVGTIHGAFIGQEYIRFELLEEIQGIVPDSILVLHGASGIADDHLKKAAKENVCKVNVDTEMRIAFEKAVKAYFQETHEKVDPRKMLGPARDAVRQVVEQKMKVLGSAGEI